tara:strand:- start:30 stop:377 length:348 start_codon:yes stop_codon:yes gene_type:complete
MSPNDFMFNLVVQSRSHRIVQKPRQQVIRRIYVKSPIIEKEEIVEKEEIIFVIGGDTDLELKQNELELNKMREEDEVTRIKAEEEVLTVKLNKDFELEEVYEEKQISPENNMMNE